MFRELVNLRSEPAHAAYDVLAGGVRQKPCQKISSFRCLIETRVKEVALDLLEEVTLDRPRRSPIEIAGCAP